MVAATASIAMILVVGIAISAWQWRRAEDALMGEAKQRKEAEGRTLAETKAKEEANHQRQRAEEISSHLEIQRGQEFFAGDDPATALAYLADVLRRQPTNRVAAEQLLFSLTHRSFPLRLAEPIRTATRPGQTKPGAPHSSDCGTPAPAGR
jgi:hypothetical protein